MTAIACSRPPNADHRHRGLSASRDRARPTIIAMRQIVRSIMPRIRQSSLRHHAQLQCRAADRVRQQTNQPSRALKSP
jgi:hypothetical protein